MIFECVFWDCSDCSCNLVGLEDVSSLTSDCYLDGGVGLPVLLTGGSWETAMRRTLTAIPEPETTLRGGGTGHMTTSNHQPDDYSSALFL